MAEIRRSAQAVWSGDLSSGKGRITTNSRVLKDTAYGFATRFGDELGTNPEELIAAAHAACYNMALAHTLSSKGHPPRRIQTRAICSLSPQETGGFRITKMHLKAKAEVPDIDEAAFQQIAHEAEAGCPVSNALRGSLEIELDATLA
jgi:osmotically inducible protein OsmC